MILVAELRDMNKAQEVVELSQKAGVECEIQRDEIRKIIGIYVENEDEFGVVQDILRTVLGLPKPIEVDEEWVKIQELPLQQTTKSLIALSIIFSGLFFIDRDLYGQYFLFDSQRDELFASILSGEFWRLITPAFVHFSFFHILFNLMWLKSLGPIIEKTKGPLFFLTLFFVSSITSNIGQYLVSGPFFGGMSGVVYALFGHLWMRTRFEEDFSYRLPKRDIVMMIGWFFLCFTGLFGPIANSAHAIGLGVGMLFGVFSLGKQRKLERFFFGLCGVFIAVLTTMGEFYF